MAFANSSSESDAPLAASMRDLLIARLANTPGLVLLSKSAIDEAARQHADPRMLARNLAATHLLETTVLRSGRDLMLSVTLSRGDSGVIVWTDSVSAPDSNVAELQQRLADGIRRALLIPTAAAGDRSPVEPRHQRRDGAHPLRAGDDPPRAPGRRGQSGARRGTAARGHQARSEVRARLGPARRHLLGDTTRAVETANGRRRRSTPPTWL